LTKPQFDAAVALLKDQHTIIGEYWNDYTKTMGAFEQGSTVIGTTWQVIKNLASNTDKLKTLIPKEGSTGWSDTWMISSKAAHPNCMYMWMEYITSPEVQAQVAYYFGEAPANPKACPEINTLYQDATHCDVFKATDEAFAKSIAFWATPRKACLDGSGSDCVPFVDWIKAWTEIKG
jgi:putative spermidine/putrescine transport system substrate-binding protein